MTSQSCALGPAPRPILSLEIASLAVELDGDQAFIETRETGASGGCTTTAPPLADRRGTTASFALMNLQERGQLFVGPGEEVYEGMVIGENARAEDLDVNPTKEKQQTNIRAAGSDEAVRLVPHHRLSLDQALEHIRDDECVEVTPEAVRLRKVALPAVERVKLARAGKRGVGGGDLTGSVPVLLTSDCPASFPGSESGRSPLPH
jgi:hypothetical protein